MFVFLQLLQGTYMGMLHCNHRQFHSSHQALGNELLSRWLIFLLHMEHNKGGSLFLTAKEGSVCVYGCSKVLNGIRVSFKLNSAGVLSTDS